MNRAAIAIVVGAVIGGAACAGVKTPQVRNTPRPAGVSMWVEPTDIASRNLYYGPWGAENAPDPNGVYELVELKHSGVNLGMTVKDAKGREWSVKQPFPGNLDSEAPVEVTISRLLSAVGYRQPPVYYLPSFKLKDDFGTHIETGGRFRLKHASLKEVGAWQWEDNPFVGTKEYQGLIVLLMLFNSTDLKNSNNSLYEHRDGDLVEHWYLARDVGSALGDTNRIAPRKNHAPTFERTPFIVGRNNGWVEFAYTGWYQNLVWGRITPQEVVWACSLLGQLSDAQLADAFRAGGFSPDNARRFITAIKARTQQGRAVGLSAARDERN